MKRALLTSLLVACLVSGGYIVWGAGGDFYVIPVRQAAVPEGTIIMWSGEVDPDGHPIIKGKPDTRWHVCDGTEGTPDLTGRFAMGAHPAPGGGWNIGATGGSFNFTLGTHNLPNHTHDVYGETGYEGLHTHEYQQPRWEWSHACGENFSGECDCKCATPAFLQAGNPTHVPYDTNPSHEPHTHYLTATTDGTGGGEPVTSIPPYYSLVFLMYIGA